MALLREKEELKLLQVSLTKQLDAISNLGELYQAIYNTTIVKLIDDTLKKAPKKIVYTSFDGDYLDYINHMTYVALEAGCTPINPECALGYYVSTITHSGKKVETMQDCIALELLCDELWLFLENPADAANYPEGVVGEMLAWIREKRLNGIRIYGEEMIKAFTTLTSLKSKPSEKANILNVHLKYNTLKIENLLKAINHDIIEDLNERLVNNIFENRRKVVYAATNFYDIKYSDWLRAYCYQHNQVAIVPSQLMNSFVLDVVYKDNIIPYYLQDRLSLLSKVDTIYFIKKPSPIKNIYSIDYIFDFAYYLAHKDKYKVMSLTWDKLNVPKFTNDTWALTRKERQQIFREGDFMQDIE